MRYRLAIVLLVVASAASAKDNFVKDALAQIQMGEPIYGPHGIIVPLHGPASTDDLGVVPGVGAKGVAFEEPSFPAHMFNVRVVNETGNRILVLGGTVLVGGKRDRLIRRDAIIAANATDCELRALPAATDRRKTAEPFVVSDTLAPYYLRKKADFGGNNSLVPNFVGRWLDLRDEGDTRKSLAALSESKKLREFSLPASKLLSKLPNAPLGREYRGAIAIVRGRVQTLGLFGNNELLKAHFESALRGAMYSSAAVTLHAKDLKFKVPGGGEEAAQVADAKEKAKKLLADLQRAAYRNDPFGKGHDGENLLVRHSNGTRGQAVGLNGRLVHLAVYPVDPFQSALYEKRLDVPEGEMPEPGEEVAEDDGDLTADESEYLRRTRRRRRAHAGAGRPRGGGGGRR
ncbi:MAG: hypothetical protein V3T86_16605 [Planctomycetota bacterium]